LIYLVALRLTVDGVLTALAAVQIARDHPDRDDIERPNGPSGIRLLSAAP
jgi:hypothetical protein